MICLPARRNPSKQIDITSHTTTQSWNPLDNLYSNALQWMRCSEWITDSKCFKTWPLIVENTITIVKFCFGVCSYWHLVARSTIATERYNLADILNPWTVMLFNEQPKNWKRESLKNWKSWIHWPTEHWIIFQFNSFQFIYFLRDN